MTQLRDILSLLSLITGSRTWTIDDGEVIDGYVACFSSHRRLQDHLVDFFQSHMSLHQQPLIPLVS